MNITLLTYENLSYLNLSSLFYNTSDGFVLNLSGTWNVSYSTALNSPAVFKDGVVNESFTQSGSLFTANITSGVYRFIDDVSFSVAIADSVVYNESFNVSVTYETVSTGTDFSSGCRLYFDSVESSFSSIRLFSSGFVPYNVTCTGIGERNETGYIYVSDKLYFDWKEEIGLLSVVDRSQTTAPWLYIFSILNESTFIYADNLNQTGEFFSNNSISTKNFALKLNSIYYFNGILLNNKNKKEVIN